eukprot:4589427-Prymnesium_polylepis.1
MASWRCRCTRCCASRSVFYARAAHFGHPAGMRQTRRKPTGYGLFGAQTVRAMCAHSSSVHSE